MSIPPYLWYAPVHPLARRVTDRERDQGLTMLTAALQRGQLTVEEHSARVEQILRAQTVGDLVRLTHDVVPAPPPPPAPGVAPRASGLADGALVTGIVSLALFPLFVAGVIAIVLGLVSLAEVRAGTVAAGRRPRALAGIVTGVLGLAGGVVFYVLI